MEPEIEQLVQEIIPQARSEAWRIFQSAPHALDLDELISLAYTGLMQAAARWPEYCARHGYSPAATQYFGAYVTRRMRGAMLDAMRSDDYVTRSMRANAKALRAAGQDLGRTEAELSASTGLTQEKVRQTLAGMARKPVSFDAEPVEVAEPAGVEDQVVVSSVLAAVVAACRELPVVTQVIIVMHYFHGKELRDIAEMLDIGEARVSALHVEGVIAVHARMVRSVSE